MYNSVCMIDKTSITSTNNHQLSKIRVYNIMVSLEFNQHDLKRY